MGVKVNTSEFTEVFFSEELQKFYFKNNNQQQLPVSCRSFWVCRKQKFQDFKDFIKPLIPINTYITFEGYTQMLDNYLKNIQKANALLIEVKFSLLNSSSC
ncbi:hypothetical protein T190115A13A_80210 [Tenacibaculum sp. 190524A02b]|uniref:Uncharacterized protein n=1 Tax=Tenacibaculum vairaonense TaxID=3137860 RepID=A0ABP1FHI6_9FLAO